MRAIWLMALLMLSACVPSQAETSKTPVQAAPAGEVREVLATVRYIPLEGGFFGLVASDGTQYDPINLSQEFQQDNLPVRATLRPLRGVASYRMWGTIVEILAMEKR